MKFKIIPYNPKLKVLAKNLRKQSTLSEILLWKKLSRKQILGYDFDRQKPIDEFIVDFYCRELFLAIEIDGATHENKIQNDINRQKRLEELGINVLRFRDGQVKKDIESVIGVIYEWIIEKNKK